MKRLTCYVCLSGIVLAVIGCSTATRVFAYHEIINELQKSESGTPENKTVHLIKALQLFLEHEERLSSSEQEQIVFSTKKFIHDKDMYHAKDGDMIIRIDQLASLMLAFMGDDSRKSLFQSIPRNTAAFPDLCAYALLWLGDRESISFLHERMYISQMWSLDILPLMNVTIDRADYRLLNMKKTIQDNNTLKKIDDILLFHTRLKEQGSK